MKMYKNIVHTFKIGEEPSDMLYWAKKNYKERAMAIEHLRQMNNGQKSGNIRTRRKLQRVYRIIKLEKS